MPSSSIVLSQFNGGEYSPRMDGRVDLSKYHNGCSLVENFNIIPQGGLTRRGGTRHVGSGKTGADKIRLIPFQFNVEQSYILEFGDGYIRFYTDKAQLQSGGSPVEVTTPYSLTDIWDIQYVQSADTMYVVHKDHAPRKLIRTGATTFTFNTVTFTSQPTEWTTNNFPQTVAFYEERLWLAGTPNEPQTLWASKTADFEDFTQGALDDDSLEYSIATDEVNVIRWLSPGSVLIVGTTGGEFTVAAGSQNDAVTPSSVRIVRQTNYGSAFYPAIRAENVVLFQQRNRRKIRQLVFDFETDGFVAPDMTLLSEHISVGGLSQMAWAAEPWNNLYAVRGDGQLLCMTFLKDQDVVGWTRHVMGGVSDANDSPAVVESVASIHAAADESYDEVWVSVKRYINGSTVRHIEVLEPGLEDGDVSTASFFVDSGLSHNGAATDTFSGLDHLEGETVSVLADGAVHPDVTVSSGSITLSYDASVVHVGLPYTSTVGTMRLAAQTRDNTGYQGHVKRIERVYVRMYDSLGLKIGPKLDKMDTIPFRSSSDAMNEGVALFTGDVEVPFPSGYDSDAKVFIKQDQPLPMTLLSMTLDVKVSQ